MNTATFTRRLRISGVFVLLGLVMQVISLMWLHPLAFLVFCGGGDVAIVLGIVMYFWSLLSYTTDVSRAKEPLPEK